MSGTAGSGGEDSLSPYPFRRVHFTDPETNKTGTTRFAKLGELEDRAAGTVRSGQKAAGVTDLPPTASLAQLEQAVSVFTPQGKTNI